MPSKFRAVIVVTTELISSLSSIEELEEMIKNSDKVVLLTNWIRAAQEKQGIEGTITWRVEKANGD